MSLPKIAAPIFELVQPSTEEKIQFRPFLVKEEKTLLIARESGERKDIFNSMKSVISSCVQNEDFDINKIPLFDMEYIFVQIRSKSVNNIIKFQVDDSTDGKTYDLEVNLDEVKVKFPKDAIDNKIKINENLGICLRYPTPEIEDLLNEKLTTTEIIFETLNFCIDYVYDEDNVYQWKDYSIKEKEEFIDSLPIETYNNVQKFFEEIPSLYHEVTYENSEGVTKKVVFRSLEDFFTFY